MVTLARLPVLGDLEGSGIYRVWVTFEPLLLLVRLCRRRSKTGRMGPGEGFRPAFF